MITYNPPVHVNPYSKPTVELVLKLLSDAFEDEDKLDKFLSNLSESVFKEVRKLLTQLEKDGKIKLDEKFNLANHPQIYRALKEIERDQFQRMLEYFWMGEQVLKESMTRSYVNTMLKTYEIYGKPTPGTVQYTTSYSKPNTTGLPGVKITDTYITEKILNVPWCQDGKTYSQRLYGHVANFQSKLAFVLEEGINKGKGMDWMMQAWRKLTKSTAYDTARLLKTETMAMWSLATKETLLSIGVEYVEILGDAMCGGICLDYVGEAVPLAEAQIGDLLPPYHPNCACSFVEYTETIEVPAEDLEETLDEYYYQ